MPSELPRFGFDMAEPPVLASLTWAMLLVNKQSPTDTQDRTIKQTNMGNEP
jgi:hypothetical protein